VRSVEPLRGRDRSLFLIGMPGAGKSTVGPLVARTLSLPFVDLDRRLEEEACQSIPALFSSEGEARFREREAALLARVCVEPPQVVATGGGTPVRSDNLARMRAAGWIVALAASVETLLQRLEHGSGRPLVDGGEGPAGRRGRIEALLGQRTAAYAAAHVTVDTDGCAPEQVARAVCSALERLPC
jgi:shikimate kinase